MSGYAPSHQDDLDEADGPSPLWRALRLTVWAVVSFALTFIELIAEWVAPLLLLGGLAWLAVVKVVGTLHLEPEIQQFLHYVPSQVLVAGTVWTPVGLITQGITLLAIVAGCRTLNRLISRDV